MKKWISTFRKPKAKRLVNICSPCNNCTRTADSNRLKRRRCTLNPLGKIDNLLGISIKLIRISAMYYHYERGKELAKEQEKR